MSVTFNFQGSGLEGLNVSNRNAATVCDMIGVPFDFCGEVSPDTVIANLAVANPSTIETTDNHGVEISSEGVKSVCRVVDFGLTHEQLARYACSMLEIALAAREAGESIFWG